MSPSEAALFDLTLIVALWAAVLLSTNRRLWLLARVAFPLWAALCCLPKSYYAARILSDSLRPWPYAWLWTIGLLLAVTAPLILLPLRAGRWLCWIFVALVTLLLWADVLYYRAMDDFLSLTLWSGVHQASSVTDSLRHLVSAADLVFLVNLLLVLPAVLIAAPDRERSATRSDVALAFLPATIFLIGNLAYDPLSSQFLKQRLSNRVQVARNGLLAYHLYDLYQAAQPLFSHPKPIPDAIVSRRLTLSRNSINPRAPHFGAAKGANVLMMQLESFQSFVIGMKVDGQEVTPFLNRLRRESLYGEALDQTSLGASSDAEYVMLNGLLPPLQGPLCFRYASNSYRSLPTLLAERGWSTLKAMPYDGAFWNARGIGKRYGYQQQLFVDDFPSKDESEMIGWGLSDAATFEQLVPRLKAQKAPFYCYLTTVMMHHPFDELNPDQERLRLPRGLQNTMAGDYLQLARLRDEALEGLVERMREEGLWEKTVLVLCGDHRGRLEENELQRLGVYKSKALLDRVPLFIHLPGSRAKGELPPSLGQVDVAPTLLHLLGLEDAFPVMVGRNALAGPHATVSPSGYITDGTEAWDQPETPPVDLWQQREEELQVSDNLVITDRILDFAREGPSSLTAKPGAPLRGAISAAGRVGRGPSARMPGRVLQAGAAEGGRGENVRPSTPTRVSTHRASRRADRASRYPGSRYPGSPTVAPGAPPAVRAKTVVRSARILSAVGPASPLGPFQLTAPLPASPRQRITRAGASRAETVLSSISSIASP